MGWGGGSWGVPEGMGELIGLAGHLLLPGWWVEGVRAGGLPLSTLQPKGRAPCLPRDGVPQGEPEATSQRGCPALGPYEQTREAALGALGDSAPGQMLQMDPRESCWVLATKASN